MVENRRVCSFCGNLIEPGTGKMFVKKDGTTLHFCKNKCQKNMLKLGRVPRQVKWSKRYEKVPVVETKKRIKRKPKEGEEEKKVLKKRPLKRAEAKPEAKEGEE